MRRHTLLFFALALALASAPYCRGQKTLQSILPDRFGDWVSTAAPGKVKPAAQDAAFLSEAGLEEWLIRPYSNGSQILNVSLKRFHDPSGAYEAYTALLDTDLEPSTVGQLTAIGHGRLIMLIGNFLVIVDQPQLASTASLRELAGMVRKSADTTPLPPIRAYLPQGFADGTQRYALGPVAFRAALSGLGQAELAPLT